LNEAPGTVHACSEYTYHDVINNDDLEMKSISMPVFAVLEAMALSSDRLMRSMTRAAREAEADTDNSPFGPKSHTSPKEGGSTTKKRNSKPKKSSEVPAKGAQNTDVLPAKMRSGSQKKSGGAQPPVNDNGDQFHIDRSSEDPIPSTEPNALTNIEDLPDLEHMDDSLLNIVNSGSQHLDLEKLIANSYSDDLFFKQILETPSAFHNFEVDNGLIYLKSSDHRVLCVPKLTYNGHNLREIVISEAHSILAHLGLRKTLDYLRDHFWWKEMVEDTRSFCESCPTCKHSKLSNQKPYGILHSLNPPLKPWDSVGVDFVGPLPESKIWSFQLHSSSN
jgi:hypothetical protein